jgi:hypothetical protein
MDGAPALGPFVDQVAALRLESLDVPVCWEATPDHRPKSPAEELISRVTDVVGAATLGLARKFIDPRILDSVDRRKPTTRARKT